MCQGSLPEIISFNYFKHKKFYLHPMKIVIITVGSRGDAQPCVALALGLLKEGNDVVIGAPPNHKAFISGFGIKVIKSHQS